MDFIYSYCADLNIGGEGDGGGVTLNATRKAVLLVMMVVS